MPSPAPKISVITVCYNAGEKIINTINSVLNQSYPFIEYIIIDGASADSTMSIINSFNDRINLVISEPDNGIYDAMNKGIKKATGNLIIFLNAGDYYISPFVLEYAVSKIDLQQADVFFARFIWESPLTKDIVLSDHSSVKYDWDLKNSNFPHPATFYKKEVFTKVGFFDESLKIMADYEWNVRALVKYRIAFKYVNIITALFTADGISNDSRRKSQIDQENSDISSRYYHPELLFIFIEKYLSGNRYFSNVLKKIIAKFFDKRLNRMY